MPRLIRWCAIPLLALACASAPSFDPAPIADDVAWLAHDEREALSLQIRQLAEEVQRLRQQAAD